MDKILKIVTNAIVISGALFLGLDLLISDLAPNETFTSRIVAITSLAIISVCLLWLIFSRKRKLPAVTLLVIGILIFIISAFQPNLLAGYRQSSTPPEREIERSKVSLENKIQIFSPKPGETINSPLLISGKATGNWFFEAEFSAELYDSDGNFLGRTILTAKGDWMTKELVPFEGELNFLPPTTSLGVVRFLSANPSGLPERQMTFEIPVHFENVPLKKVLLYYYNPEKDKDETGNIKCSKDGLVAVEREIKVTKTPIQDTINLLLKGKDNLTAADISKGITTEYPLERFSLAEVNFKNDGTLILKFNDPLHKTSGGSCRVSILWLQIEATAKQYPVVKKVQFLPEDLFQP